MTYIKKKKKIHFPMALTMFACKWKKRTMNTNQEKQNINQMLSYGRIIFILDNIRSRKCVFVNKPDFYLMFNTLIKSNEVGIEPSSPQGVCKIKAKSLKQNAVQ